MKSFWCVAAFLLASVHAGLAFISVGLGGASTITFDAKPSISDWSTYSIAGSSTAIGSAATLDATVQMTAAASFTNALLTDSSMSPTPHALASWSAQQFVYTGPAGVAAEMLMATLHNDTGSTLSSLNISYDFGVVPGGAPPEEIPGQRVYFSLTGATNSWQLIPALSGDTNSGPRSTWIQLGSWPAGTFLYLMWVQDNAIHSPDACYTIDNFYATPVVCDSFVGLQPFSDVTCHEGQPASFSINLCPNEHYTFQWFKNNTALPGATNALLSFTRARLTDAATYYAVLSNATDQLASRHATLTVLPDDDPPRALLAYQAEDTNSPFSTVVVFFSERVDTNSAQMLTNYSLSGSAWPESPPEIVDASAVSETNVVLHVENFAPGMFLSVRDVTDQSSAHHLLAPNPTTLPVQTFATPIIAADGVWKYFEAPTNTTWPGWMNLAYDDSAWISGPGAIGFPLDEVLPTPFVVRTMIHPPSNGGTITTYCRTKFNLFAWETNSVVQFSGVFDDGAIVYLNGTELWRVRMPPGFATTSTQSSNSFEPHPPDGPVDIFAQGILRAGTNVLAVEVHQTALTSGDVVMALLMRLSRSTLVVDCFPSLNVTRGPGGAISVAWNCGDGTLQVSSTVGGPPQSWHDVTASNRSFTTNVSSGSLFFRVRP